MRDGLAQLAPYLPFDAPSLEAADAALPFATDALLKRFENLVNHLQDQVWRRAAVALSFRDPAAMSRRDLADAMERLGFLPSADAFVEVIRTRNRLSHLYPDDPARQARRLNKAVDRSALLLAATDAAVDWAASRLTPPAAP